MNLYLFGGQGDRIDMKHQQSRVGFDEVKALVIE
jgi:hypothetical protein